MSDFIEIIEEDETFSKTFGGSILHGRRFSSETLKQIRKRHTKHSRNRQTGMMTPETDEDAVNDDLIDYIITGWDNVKSPTTGDAVPCNRENKLKLPGPIKAQFVDEATTDNITGKK